MVPRRKNKKARPRINNRSKKIDIDKKSKIDIN
jgi:hypothetical protein